MSMSMARTLDHVTTIAVAEALPRGFAGLERSFSDLWNRGLADRAVGVGDLIALPILRTTDDRPIDLIEIAAGRAVVLVFTRRGWSPACDPTLSAYAAALSRIEAAGGLMVAVMPDWPGMEVIRGRSADGRPAVAVDEGNRFAQSLGLVVAPPGALRLSGHATALDGPARIGKASPALTRPATYVLAPCGRVTWAHVDSGAAHRADPDAIVAALERLARVPDVYRDTVDRHAWDSLR